ncbi:3-ketosteroid reductase [Ophiocordyceps sinensis CO18]|uniref:3-ketosteroid reductase n=1 Tax=Ophiocordyceps sinensis (strain Co18 / CGMCC 3.14243) TaxID=911162 RepID=T5ACF5_OPHSC|nr:3-ketosteroid reductase [Ophiocordyceps sinensis CO18]
MAMAEKAPWESAAAHEQLFVLITGANSGVGLGTAQRLVDEFLATRPATAPLVLLATTRSAAKSRQAIRAAAVWLALEPQDALDDARAHRVKWGSSSDRHRRAHVKKTEVEGWGWEGRVQVVGAHDDDDDISPHQVLRKSTGRKHGVVDVTAEDIVRFEELGAACWRDMEELRATWEDILDRQESDRQESAKGA